MSINLEEMKDKLNKDLQRELDQEAKESGRLSEPIKEEISPNRSDPERIEEKKEEIDLDKILEEAPEDEKGNKIIPDHIFNEYYKNLPNGTKNQSGTWRVNNSGKLRIFGGDPEADKEIQRAGAEASNAAQAHRRTLADDLKIALSKKATRATLQALDLQDGATNQDAITAAAILQASEGNVKALLYIRDTIGEQPTAKQDVSVTMTDADKALLDQVQKRLGIDEDQG